MLEKPETPPNQAEDDNDSLLKVMKVLLVIVLISIIGMVAAVAITIAAGGEVDVLSQFGLGPKCEHNGFEYEQGEEVPYDSCNHCSCDGGEIVCTNMACEDDLDIDNVVDVDNSDDGDDGDSTSSGNVTLQKATQSCQDDPVGNWNLEISIPEQADLSYLQYQGTCVFKINYLDSILEISTLFDPAQVSYSSVDNVETIYSSQAGDYVRGKMPFTKDECHQWGLVVPQPASDMACEMYAYGQYQGEDPCFENSISDGCPAEKYSKYMLADSILKNDSGYYIGTNLRLKGEDVTNPEVIELFDEMIMSAKLGVEETEINYEYSFETESSVYDPDNTYIGFKTCDYVNSTCDMYAIQKSKVPNVSVGEKYLISFDSFENKGVGLGTSYNIITSSYKLEKL